MQAEKKEAKELKEEQKENKESVETTQENIEEGPNKASQNVQEILDKGKGQAGGGRKP
jgi:predicted  nucleic acid-binding Zn-ribbon protein